MPSAIPSCHPWDLWHGILIKRLSLIYNITDVLNVFVNFIAILIWLLYIVILMGFLDRRGHCFAAL